MKETSLITSQPKGGKINARLQNKIPHQAPLFIPIL
jgi:hypothetical protein